MGGLRKMLKLYKFFEDCGRMGDLEGMFVADDERVDAVEGLTIYLSDVLGKHSEIEVELGSSNIKVMSDDPPLMHQLMAVFPNGTLSGINPLEYLD
jgi:hypothetical protein